MNSPAAALAAGTLEGLSYRKMNLLLALLLATPLALPAAERSGISCVKRTKQGLEEPKDLPELLTCQAGTRRAFVADTGPNGAAFDRFDEFQRREIREYLRRHPRRATTRTARERSQESRRKAPIPKSRENAAGAPVELTPEIMELKRKLQAKSQDGKLGVTPEMALDITNFLNAQQGGMSSDMRALLNTLSKDGADLSHGSMLRLKGAAREANAAGLDLGVKPELGNWLIDPRTDPDVQLPATPRN